MAIAAVPRYLGEQFGAASPGMRYSYFLSIWTAREDQERALEEKSNGRSREAHQLSSDLQSRGMDAVLAEQVASNKLPGMWEKNDRVAHDAWSKLLKLNRTDKATMAALTERQAALAKPLVHGGQLLRIEALAVAPFTTGLGNEHPLENGFAFLSPYGLPYLPASGVKGVLRQAARELASGDWGDSNGWDTGKSYSIQNGRQSIALSIGDALFGKSSADGDTDHVRGALIFWDVFPQLLGHTLSVDVMTPHQTHYYQHGQSPHESGSPKPVNFLTVPPGSGFAFHVQCNRPFLETIAPDLTRDDRWKDLLMAAFEHAFAWLGFGAKTAVGYGAMERDRRAEEAARKEAAEEVERVAREAEARQRRETEVAEAARRQAEWEALPESEKALRRFEEELKGVTGQPPLDKNRYAVFAGIVNDFAKQASAWADDSARNRAAVAIEAAFERFGWTPSGLKPDRRKKQEQKRRSQIEAVRGKAS